MDSENQTLQAAPAPEQEKQFLMPASLRDALLAYLSQKPFAEVADGIQALSNLKEA